MDEIECVVIGAGVVGLAIARQLARAGRDVVVLESEATIGTGASSRNSEVIHAGIYYDPGSLKARLCLEGRAQLYAFCEQHGVSHRKCGKLIVATHTGQMAELDGIFACGHANGVADLVRLDPAQARRLEPDLACLGALYSPSTGIIDSHGLMLALQGDAESHGAVVAFGSRVSTLRATGNRIELETVDGIRLTPKLVINAAGLAAPALAATLPGFPTCTAVYAKGSYFSLRGRSPFSHLIYPIPEPGGLGIHLTLDLAGQARFGPDVEWIDTIDYGVAPERVANFIAAITAWWPALTADRLVPAYAGIRPKVAFGGVVSTDFHIAGPAAHGIPGLITLLGIDSPGLTACLAIAHLVSVLADEAIG